MKRKTRHASCYLLMATLMTLAVPILTVEKASYYSVSAQVFVNVSQDITVELTPLNTQLSLTVRPSTVEIRKLVILTARLTDENGASIEDAEITFRLSNIMGIVTTGNDGTATFGFTPQTPGNYEVKAEYTGSSRYFPATKIGIISVQAGIEFPYLPVIIVTATAIFAILIVIFYKHRIIS